MLLRDEKLARMASLPGALERTESALPLSSEAIITLINQHLACKNVSHLPVLDFPDAYEAAVTRLAESMLPLNSRNVEDLQTGSLGDVEICFLGDDSVVTAYEMKVKSVTGQPESHERSLRGAGPGYHNESRCAGDRSCTGRRSQRFTCGLAAILQQLEWINDRLIIGC